MEKSVAILLFTSTLSIYAFISVPKVYFIISPSKCHRQTYISLQELYYIHIILYYIRVIHSYINIIIRIITAFNSLSAGQYLIIYYCIEDRYPSRHSFSLFTLLYHNICYIFYFFLSYIDIYIFFFFNGSGSLFSHLNV